MFSTARYSSPPALARAALIIVALSATLSASVSQRAQTPVEQADTVTIQPTTGARPVTVTADKSRVRVGQAVRFSLIPASIVGDRKHSVTVDFGDGTRLATRQTVVTHRYRAKGHYKVYATVVPSGIETGPQKPDPQRAIPKVTLDARPSPADTGKPVSFSAQLSSNNPLIKFRFSFGDGAQTAWQGSSVASHAYAAPGRYPAYVDLGLDNGGRINQVGGSLRQTIVVNQVRPPPDTVIPKPPVQVDTQPGPVTLSANPTPAVRGQPVVFDARARSTNADVRYRFVFGDGSSSNWQSGARTTHEYRAAGRFLATVQLGLIRNGRIRALSDDRQTVRVTNSPDPNKVDFDVNPTPVGMGQQVTFNARATPAPGNLRYRFFFGDASSPTDWQTGTQASYSYPAAGEYSAHVEIGEWSNGRVNPIATSSPKMISVTTGAIASASPGPSPANPAASPSGTIPSVVTTVDPTPSPGDGNTTPITPSGFRDNWWLYLVLALLAIFVAYQVYRALAAPPRTTFHAKSDHGSAEIDAAAKGLEINSQVLMRPNVSEAEYLVYSDDAIVRSVRRENV